MRASTFPLMVLTLVVCGCGGEGGSGDTILVPAPAPTPAPTPSPTSNPSPNVAFRAIAAAPLVGTVIFDTNGSGVIGDSIQGNSDLIVATNRSGEFGRDAVGRQSSTMPPANATVVGEMSGASTLTGFIYSNVGAPLGAAIYSPVTSLFGSTDEIILATNLGLGLTGNQIGNFDSFAGLSSPDGTIQMRAKQITALNLKLLAQAGLETRGKPSVTSSISVWPNLDSVRAQLLTGAVNFNSSTSILQILARSRRAAFTSDEGGRAAAQLLARYGEAVDRYLTSAARIADIEYGLRLLVLPELEVILNSNLPTSAQVSRISAITTDDLVSGFSEFASINAISATSTAFVPVVDYFSISGVTETTLASRCTSGSNSPTCNDVDFTVGAPLDVQTVQLTDVHVPAQFASKISVTRGPDGTLILRRLAAERQLVWFEYDARNQEGASGTSRAYVLLSDGQ